MARRKPDAAKLDHFRLQQKLRRGTETPSIGLFRSLEGKRPPARFGTDKPMGGIQKRKRQGKKI